MIRERGTTPARLHGYVKKKKKENFQITVIYPVGDGCD